MILSEWTIFHHLLLDLRFIIIAEALISQLQPCQEGRQEDLQPNHHQERLHLRLQPHPSY